MTDAPRNGKYDGVLGVLHVAVVVVFGWFFLTGFLSEDPPDDSVSRWFEIFWSIGAIGLGVFATLYTEKFISGNAAKFSSFYEKTGIPIFKAQAEGMQRAYMYPFAKAIGTLFVVIGFVILLRDVGFIHTPREVPLPFIIDPALFLPLFAITLVLAEVDSLSRVSSKKQRITRALLGLVAVLFLANWVYGQYLAAEREQGLAIERLANQVSCEQAEDCVHIDCVGAGRGILVCDVNGSSYCRQGRCSCFLGCL